MKLKISIKKLWNIIFVIFLLIILFNIFSYLRPVKTIMYKERSFTFRENVKATKNTPVLNNETYIHNIFWDPNIETVKILFQPNVTNVGYYSVEAYELTNKLYWLYILDGIEMDFSAEPIESYDNIEKSTDELKIVLIHPDLTNETYIKADDNIIYIAGKDLKDFDLAVIKTIFIAMNFKI